MSWLTDAKKCIEVVNIENNNNITNNEFEKMLNEIIENINKLERNEENLEFLKALNNITRR